MKVSTIVARSAEGQPDSAEPVIVWLITTEDLVSTFTSDVAGSDLSFEFGYKPRIRGPDKTPVTDRFNFGRRQARTMQSNSRMGEQSRLREFAKSESLSVV